MKRNIYFIPEKNVQNKYTELIQESFIEAGFKRSDFFQSNYIYLNWYENVNPNNIILALLSFFKKILYILSIIILGKKLIWTFHNYEPHHRRFSNFNFFLESWIIFCSKYVVIHSKSSKSFLLKKHSNIRLSKIIFLPHPNYIQSYPIQSFSESNDKKEEIVFLFLGLIKPYKNIESLIRVFNYLKEEKVLLKIYGKADLDYQRELMKLCQSPNIELNFGFVDDSRISKIIHDCDLVITPYLPGTMLNSGTHILSFSLGKTVLTTPVCTDLDIDENLWFKLEDLSNIDKSIIRSIENIIKNYSKEDLEYMGKELFNLMKRDYSIEKIANMITKTIK
ncbi:glycosyltransferase family 4 protein [Lactococcus lactis]|jgi:glycosyltransferase involved in cell wall biosynthesis|uniref:Glycosyltransferase n=1 Tax=Lactococcus lactis TaxID=1358 RepID=A0A3Q9TD06_9LACT|nr:glycosyltransferase family 4 protein [Lactococcus lactis]AZY91819.1 glycosyltransferase [Lactococcus lactis]MDG4983286.1 glycosyltransferase family 4 protein [Lactococcus lactis]MDM7498896.1 glycosyltransferase family 4 protein [Lactococcus lactis]